MEKAGEGASWRWLRTVFLVPYPTSNAIMWIYQISSGRMIDPNGLVVGFGYSGKGSNKNNPESQNLTDKGPIPEGYYRIGTPHDTVTHGPFVIPLTPDTQNKMFGRSHFLIHGDSVVNPGTASEGCIIMARSVREDIAKSMDDVLGVVSGPYTPQYDSEEVRG